MNVRIAECRMRCSIEAGNSQGRDSPPPPLAPTEPQLYCVHGTQYTVHINVSVRAPCVFNSTW
jgi:hypothetical protein